MQTVSLQSRVGSDGVLNLRIPVKLRDEDVEVIVVVQPVASKMGADAGGWPPGFFEHTFGCLEDEPIERLPQGSFETREPLE